ncbi:hypothetical protein B5M09_011440 [Aphanomyces astaci]|uniref:Uncharacterized protein n=1 Tax=Aphanomyces astaci TaxID=112090 RepID=A0A3R7WC89_APHAT|nr:hypothetical protein B5M09_011440 [Aphanomyces astaci]
MNVIDLFYLKATLKAVVQNHLEHQRNSVLQFMTYFKTKLVVQLEFTRVTKAVVLLKAAWKASLWQVDEASKRAILLKKDFPRMPANTFDAPRRPPVCWACCRTASS